MSTQYAKVKSVAKTIRTKGPALRVLVNQTLKTMSDIVGDTLGPGGQPVLIERQEVGLAPMITKDGVTVARNLGFADPVAHVIMETAREPAVRTAQEAGDGTTTAVVLGEALTRLTSEYCDANPQVSPQRVCRRLEAIFRDSLEPAIRGQSLVTGLVDENHRRLLHGVARVSANGDVPLADAVMQCFDLVGNEGNVTLVESSGPSKYEVERIDGFPIGSGYEDSCAKYYPMFINDQERQCCRLESPFFVLYHGRLNEIQTAQLLLERIGQAWQADGRRHDVVIVATGFSDSVLSTLALNFSLQTTINVYPLLVPMFPVLSGQLDFLLDLAAVTGAQVFNPATAPLDTAQLEQLGCGVAAFEAMRYRANLILSQDPKAAGDREVLVLEREQQLQGQLKDAGELEAALLRERIGKLTGGIARLRVIGSSSGELREKRDRAEDAVCAVRGALKAGCLPGGAWVLSYLAREVRNDNDPIWLNILVPALREPFRRLLRNSGHTAEEIVDLEKRNGLPDHEGFARVYDADACAWVRAVEAGLMDSTPAVLEALRSSLSMASLMGTLSGVIVYGRDEELERKEARDTADFLRNASVNEANDRA